MLAICHTSYSLQTGVRSPLEWAAAAAARGYSELAVADLNGLYGAVHFARAARAAGVRPLIGATLLLAPGHSCIVLAATGAGYRELCRLLTARHLTRPFELGTALTAGGCDGLLFLARESGVLRELARVVPRENLYALPAASPALPAAAGFEDTVPLDLPLAAVPDAWFLEAADRETFALLRGLRKLTGTDMVPGVEFQPGAVLPEAAAWTRLFPDQETAREIAARCTFEFEFGRPCFPRIQVAAGTTPAAHLRHICQQALMHRYRADRIQVATARLDHELEVICAKGFADYFLYVREIIVFAQGAGIPVEVRGSAASSIVSYLLGFTHCCPLEHDLLFERFLNPGRKDCPDIDIDIADKRRDEVIAFCYRRWGAAHVAMVATVNTYRLAGALWDAARLAGLPPEQYRQILRQSWSDVQNACPPEVDFVGDAVARDLQLPMARSLWAVAPENRGPSGVETAAGGGILAFPDLPQLQETARRLQGLPRHLGIHCGGLLITPCPLTDMTPLTRSAKGVIISHFEKDQAEAIGLVKMDLLGNSALSVIQEATDWLARDGRTLPEPGPRHDFKVRRLFAGGDTLGVYQCESPGMRQLCCALHPETPQEAAAALSLIRPGPSAAGMKEVFIRRRLGLEPVRYLHPHMAHFLQSTYGVMLYQEDVMKVAIHLAGYTPGDADGLRRAVSKARDPRSMAREHDRFVEGQGAAHALRPQEAEQIWEQVSKFASYSFCKAHAAVYGRLAWLTARLKAHHPREFYAAILNCHKSMYPRRVFVWDAIRHGLPILPPDVQHAEERWTPVSGGVRAGLDLIRGLRAAVLRQLVQESRRVPFQSLEDLRRRVTFQAGELERLILAGTCRGLGRREELLAELMASGKHEGQLTLFRPVLEALPSAVASELWLTGIPFSAHPVERDCGGTCMAADLGRFVGRQVEIVGILDTWKPVRTQNARGATQEMAFVTLEDVTGLFELVLFPDVFARLRRRFSGLGPYRVRGVVDNKWGFLLVEVEGAEAEQGAALADGTGA